MLLFVSLIVLFAQVSSFRPFQASRAYIAAKTRLQDGLLDGRFLSFEEGLEALADGKTASGEDVEKVIETSILTLTKVSNARLASVAKKFDPSIELTKEDEDNIEILIRASLDSAWIASDKDFDKMVVNIKAELDDEIEETSDWMKSALGVANELSISKLKDMIRQYGGILPKSIKSESGESTIS